MSEQVKDAPPIPLFVKLHDEFMQTKEHASFGQFLVERIASLEARVREADEARDKAKEGMREWHTRHDALWAETGRLRKELDKVRQAEWISVKDRLPDEGVKVLAYRRGVYALAYRGQIDDEYLSDTQWMQLPDPPVARPEPVGDEPTAL